MLVDIILLSERPKPIVNHSIEIQEEWPLKGINFLKFLLTLEKLKTVSEPVMFRFALELQIPSTHIEKLVDIGYLAKKAFRWKGEHFWNEYTWMHKLPLEGDHERMQKLIQYFNTKVTPFYTYSMPSKKGENGLEVRRVNTPTASLIAYKIKWVKTINPSTWKHIKEIMYPACPNLEELLLDAGIITKEPKAGILYTGKVIDVFEIYRKKMHQKDTSSNSEDKTIYRKRLERGEISNDVLRSNCKEFHGHIQHVTLLEELHRYHPYYNY